MTDEQFVEGYETPVCPKCGKKGTLKEGTWVFGTNYIVAIKQEDGRVKYPEYDGEWDDHGWLCTRSEVLGCGDCGYEENITDETRNESLQKWLPTKNNEKED